MVFEVGISGRPSRIPTREMVAVVIHVVHVVACTREFTTLKWLAYWGTGVDSAKRTPKGDASRFYRKDRTSRFTD